MPGRAGSRAALWAAHSRKLGLMQGAQNFDLQVLQMAYFCSHSYWKRWPDHGPAPGAGLPLLTPPPTAQAPSPS